MSGDLYVQGTTRHSLTVVGKTHWDAKAAVWNEINSNHFTIRTDQSRVKVSWLVTAVRHDRFADTHPVQVLAPIRRKTRASTSARRCTTSPGSDGIGYQKPATFPRKATANK